MFNLRIVATQNCNKPSFVKNFLFHIFRATEYFTLRALFLLKGPYTVSYTELSQSTAGELVVSGTV